MNVRIEQLSGKRHETVEALAGLLVEAVAGGASLTFLHPLDLAEARSFWNSALDAAAGKRVILTAWTGDLLAGTVTLLIDTPQNQRHRAEIAKLIVRADHRGHGIASALMREAESVARACGRTVLSLDTADEGGASGLYERLGYTRAGEIPDYAYTPRGELSAAVFYWKRIR